MANFIPLNTKQVILPTVSANNIANLNNTVAGKLNLNGSLVGFDGTVSFTNYQTTVTITSLPGVDLSAISFTIVGYNKNVVVTEVIQGPNGNTVTTNNLFAKVLRISASANIAQAYTIGCNYDIAVYIEGTMQARNTATYTIFCPTRGVLGVLPVANALYLVNGKELTILLKDNLTWANAAFDICLDPIQGGGATPAGITAASLATGLFGNVAISNPKEMVFFCTGGNLNQAGQKVLISFSMD